MPGGFSIDLGTMIIALAGDSRDLDRSLMRVRAELEAAAGVFDSIASKIDSAITTAFQAGAVAAAVFGAATLSAGADFEQAMTRVGAVSNATAEELDALNEKAREIGRTTTFSAKSAADAMYVLSQAGMDTREIMASVNSVLVLAGASGMDLEESANLVAASLKQFNLPASEAGRVVDVLNTAAQKSLLSMSDLRDAMKYAGTAGAAFGQTLEETVAAVAQFRDLGLSASQSGTAFRASLNRLENPVKAGRDVLKDLNIALEDITPSTITWEGSMKKLAGTSITAAQSMKLFGTVAGASIFGVIESFRNGKQTFDELTGSFEEGAGSAAATFNRMQSSISGQFALLRNKTTDIMLSLFEDVRVPLARLLTELSSRVDFLTGQVNDQADGVRHAADIAVDGIMAVVDAILRLTPYASELATILVGLFAAAKVYQFVTAINVLAQAIGVNLLKVVIETTTAFLALDAATLFLGAGAVAVLVAGVGALAYSIQLLVGQLTGAADEAERLNQALESAKADDEVLAQILKAQQDEVRARALAGETISAEDRALVALTASQAKAQLSSGQLVIQNGKLVDSAKMTADQLRGLANDYEVQAQGTRELGKNLDNLIGKYVKLGVFDAVNRGNIQNQAALKEASKLVGYEVATYQELLDARARIANQQQILDSSAKGAENAIANLGGAADKSGKSMGELGDTAEGTGSQTDAAGKKFADLQKKLEDMRGATDAGYAAQIKLVRALDEIDQAEAAGVDAKLVTEARTATWKTFGETIGGVDKRFLSLEESSKLANGGIKVVSDGIDELTSTRLTNMFAAFTAAEEKAGTWESALISLGGALGKLTDGTGIDTTKIQANLKKLGSSVDSFFGQLIGGTTGGAASGAAVSGAIGAATGGIGALVSIALAGFEQVAQMVLKGGGDAILKWLQAFPSAIGDVISSITDLSSILDLSGVFTDATQAIKDWKDEVSDSGDTTGSLEKKLARQQARLERLKASYEGHGKTAKERRQDRRDKIQEAKDDIRDTQKDIRGAKKDEEDVKGEKPKGPAAAEAQAILDQVDWVLGFVKALPKILTALERQLPKLLGAMAGGLPKTINRLARAAIPIIREVTNAFAKALQHSDKLIHAITALAEAAMFALVYSLPVLTEALIGAMPMLITALIQDLPRLLLELTYELPAAILVGFIAAIPKMGHQLEKGLKDAMTFLAKHWLSIITFGISDLFDGGKKGKNSGGEDAGGFIKGIGDWFSHAFSRKPPGRHARGSFYVPRTMATVLEPGEAVLDRALTQAMARGTYMPPAPVGGAQHGGGLVAQMMVALDGRVVDVAMARSGAAGRMPKMQRAIRSGRGTKVGFNPGRGSFYG